MVGRKVAAAVRLFEIAPLFAEALRARGAAEDACVADNAAPSRRKNDTD
jgi:hypothetical protein